MSKIIYFDGVCNLCNGTVRFMLKHDKKKKFEFSSLQSSFARKNLANLNAQHTNFNTVVYQKDHKLYTKSQAVLHILQDLGGIWALLSFFKIIPRSWRDRLYDFIANHRYHWFGKKDRCMVPTKEYQSRFLE